MGRPTNEPANYIAFGKQAAKDTEATSFYFFRHLDGSGMEPDQTVESVREGGDGQEVGLRHRTGVSLDGQVVNNARPEGAARMLAGILHADTVAAPAAGASGAAQIHTAVPTHRGADSPYYTFEQCWADEIERVTNGQWTTVTIEGEAGRPLKITGEFLGGGTPYHRDLASALTPAREAGQPFFFPNGSYVIDGVANSKVTKFKATIRRGVDGDIRTTSLHRHDVVGLNFDTDLEYTMLYEDKALYRKVHANGGSMVPVNPVDLATGALRAYSEFGADAAHRFFELGVNHQYTGARVNKLDPDGKTMFIDVVAMGIKTATHQIYAKVQTASGGAF